MVAERTAHMLSKVAQTLIKSLHHWQEIVAQDKAIARTVEHPLCVLKESEEGQTVGKL